eukprot:TRINITY_DN2564_c0_g2_i1.p1 TRINITY_DN2564_c0_g2~~TRINITY_DN2564_c0_g2_i1.p1  ORF type:complete len:133 (-),score=8.10 TRINITY_DN2564_c0_g2_i1:5-403(-)
MCIRDRMNTQLKVFALLVALQLVACGDDLTDAQKQSVEICQQKHENYCYVFSKNGAVNQEICDKIDKYVEITGEKSLDYKNFCNKLYQSNDLREKITQTINLYGFKCGCKWGEIIKAISTVFTGIFLAFMLM